MQKVYDEKNIKIWNEDRIWSCTCKTHLTCVTAIPILPVPVTCQLVLGCIIASLVKLGIIFPKPTSLEDFRLELTSEGPAQDMGGRREAWGIILRRLWSQMDRRSPWWFVACLSHGRLMTLDCSHQEWAALGSYLSRSYTGFVTSASSSSFFLQPQAWHQALSFTLTEAELPRGNHILKTLHWALFSQNEQF